MGLKKKDLVLMGIILCIAAVCSLVHDFTGEAGKGIVAIKVDGVTEGTYVLTEDRRIEINHGTNILEIKDGEAFIYNMHISPYEQGNIFNKDPLRPRRLLLHKAQIRKWDHEVRAAGYTVVPLKVYFDRSYVKVDIALAKGKKLYDKRDTIAKNDMRRQAEKDFKIRNLTL